MPGGLVLRHVRHGGLQRRRRLRHRRRYRGVLQGVGGGELLTADVGAAEAGSERGSTRPMSVARELTWTNHPVYRSTTRGVDMHSARVHRGASSGACVQGRNGLMVALGEKRNLVAAFVVS